MDEKKGWTLIPNKPSTLFFPHIIVSGCFTSARNNSLAPNTYNMCINREVLFTCQMLALTLLSTAGNRTVWLWVILVLCRIFCAAKWLFRSSWVFLKCRWEEMEVGSTSIIKEKMSALSQIWFILAPKHNVSVKKLPKQKKTPRFLLLLALGNLLWSDVQHIIIYCTHFKNFGIKSKGNWMRHPLSFWDQDTVFRLDFKLVSAYYYLIF